MNNKFSPWPSFTQEEIEAVQNVLLSNKVNNQKIISIGPSTTKALKKAGIINVLESFQSSELALADTVFSLI